MVIVTVRMLRDLYQFLIVFIFGEQTTPSQTRTKSLLLTPMLAPC